MNVVLDDAEEVHVKDTKTKKAGDRERLGESALPPAAWRDLGVTDSEAQPRTGRLMLKGENITLISPLPKPAAA